MDHLCDQVDLLLKKKTRSCLAVSGIWSICPAAGHLGARLLPLLEVAWGKATTIHQRNLQRRD
jgi:hypothetical protein